ncbi:hypothetical protein [Streptomyces umbrinus]|uniref:hypothetical protein n=1 Tax=Streptomyces umbrinus TaxID=67370 RepID=UPI003593664F
MQHGDGDGSRDRRGDGGAGEHQERDGPGTALVDAGARLGAAQPFERRPRARGSRVGQFEEGEHRKGRGEQARRDVRGERGLVLREPFEPGAQQVVDERGDDERGPRERHRHESRTQ